MIVYYTTNSNQFVYDPEPLPHSVFSQFDNFESVTVSGLKKCPASLNYLHNGFAIKNFINYDLHWNGNGFSSSSHDKNFFNTFVLVRDPKLGFVSYAHPFMHFFCEESLEMSLLPPFMHDVSVSKDAIFIPGKYNIGKHFRPMEAAFIFKRKDTRITFERNTPLFYLFFHCKEKIKFRKFYMTQELRELKQSILTMRDGREVKPLEFWYDITTRNYRKTILKLIKSNLMD